MMWQPLGDHNVNGLKRILMISYFESLNDNEMELMFKAPILVCILIAGADGKIDNKELKEAISIAQKQAKSNSSLSEYFREASQDFEDKIKILIQSYPYELTQRNPLIIQELSELNSVLPKLNKKFAINFYESLRLIADKIASSSGGVWGIHTVGTEEAKYVQLPMINNPG